MNQSKKIDENNLNIKNEIEQNRIKIEEINNNNNKNNIQNLKNEINQIIKDNFQKEISRMNEENKTNNKKMDELINKNENEIKGIKSQITNFMNSIKKIDEFEIKYKDYIKTSEMKFKEFASMIEVIEEKYNSNIKSLALKISDKFNKIYFLGEGMNKINQINYPLQKDLNDIKGLKNNKYEDRLSSSFDNIQIFPKLNIYKNNNNINNIMSENSNNLNHLNNNKLINGTNEIDSKNSYNGGLTLDEEKNKDNNISKEESKNNNINNLKSNNNNDISLNMDKINEIKTKYPHLKNYPNEKLNELILDSKENLDKALAKLILSISSPNEYI